MKILVINAGSSSLKYQLIDMDNEKMLAKGNCEKIGPFSLTKRSSRASKASSRLHRCTTAHMCRAFVPA